jgi:3-oxoacyl-[acyl-carrier protein] reductase
MKVLVVFGSGTRLLEPLIDDYASRAKVIRIYNSLVPIPRENCVDISSIDELDEALAKFENIFKKLDIDFIGAASVYQDEMLITMSQLKIEQVLETGITEYVRIVKLLLKPMVRSKYGSMVFLSSFKSLHFGAGTSLYSASKAFGETFFSAVGKEYGRLGIRSAVIRMGYFDGKMLDQLLSEKPESRPISLKTAAVGTADELCSAIKFIIENPMTNGGVLEFDGGLNFG